MSGVTLAGSTTGPSDTPDGGATRALKLQTDAPHLVSMGGDRLSTSVTLHPLPSGRVTLGSGPGVDIPVQGTGVQALHCHIENSEGVVTIYPLCENLSIDGVKVVGPTRLSQGVMLTIGRSNYLRFNHPAEAKLMKSVLPNPRISMAPIHFEPPSEYQQNHPHKFVKKPPVVPRIRNQSGTSRDSLSDSGSDEPPSSIMTKVSKFEYLAAQNLKKSYSPKVFTSNVPTVNVPVKDVLGKDIDSLNLRKSLPQSACNYVELNTGEKLHNKSLGQSQGFFSVPRPKQPSNYVNVTLNETKNINNRLIIYENGCNPVNFDQNDPKNGPKHSKTQYFRSVTPSPTSTTQKIEHRRSGSVGELPPNFLEDFDLLANRKQEAEIRRNQAQRDRIKEQELERAEKQRLEEILSMCAEYERQSSSGSSKPSTPNRIITNGSLPRDKRASPSLNSPPPSPLEVLHNELLKHAAGGHHHNYENVPKRAEVAPSHYENVEIRRGDEAFYPPSSPRTRIKTFVTANKAADDSFETKMAVIETERKLLKEAERVLRQNRHNSKEISEEEGVNLDAGEVRKSTPTKFVYPCEEDKVRLEQLTKEKKDILAVISRIKRQMADIENQEEELQREIDLEKALINGEFKSKQLEMEKIESKKAKLLKRALRIEESMRDCQIKQEEDQLECRRKLAAAQEVMGEVEEKLKSTDKSSPEYEDTFERYLQAQEQLDNERKNFEDLEFHHLEEEANWLASREELQREINELTNRIESLKGNIRELEGQRQKTNRTNSNEYGTIQRQKGECAARLEEIKLRLKQIDSDLHATGHHLESDPEACSESDSSDDKISDLSRSLIVGNAKITDDPFGMTRSFNEQLLQDTALLEDGAGFGKKFPSQDDIDRISKVTSDAPIIEGRGSLGRKAIESLKEIERNRHLHLCQQGSQVIEQERQRVLALKQRVQEEVMSQWAQRQDSLVSSGSDGARNSGPDVETKPETTCPVDDQNRESKTDDHDQPSPRPLSEISEMSMEVGGGTLNKKRSNKPPSDKQRPLTRYLPIRGSDLDLRQHIESAGHQVVLCPHVLINSTSCRGFLHKKGSKLNGWSRRWFVFDRHKHTLTYYADKSEKKARGGAYFQAIEEVYLDHLNTVKSPNPHLTFIVKTHERLYYLMAPSPESMRIWVDVVFTGAEGYREFEHGT